MASVTNIFIHTKYTIDMVSTRSIGTDCYVLMYVEREDKGEYINWGGNR